MNTRRLAAMCLLALLAAGCDAPDGPSRHRRYSLKVHYPGRTVERYTGEGMLRTVSTYEFVDVATHRRMWVPVAATTVEELP